MDFGSLRKQYKKGELAKEDLDPSPFAQFLVWFQEAIDAEITEPNAMQLATCSLKSFPSCRTVLMKHFDEKGIVFYSNYESRKGKELSENPHAAAVFLWKDLERQVIVEGEVEKISESETAEYFKTRPRKSRLATWASKQDAPLTTRHTLIARYEELEKKYEGQEIPPPSFWGGFRLIPDRFEFWQGREDRLHDRFSYLYQKPSWKIDRLSP